MYIYKNPLINTDNGEQNPLASSFQVLIVHPTYISNSFLIKTGYR